MSHALMSASETGLPRFGDWLPGLCAKLAPVSNARATAKANNGLRIDMLDLPFAVDGPTGDAVVVLVREKQGARKGLLGLAPRRHKLGAQRLHVPGLVPGAALQDRRLAIPAPRHLEAGERLVEDGRLQRGFAPALAAIRRHQDLGDPPGAGIGDARNGVVARLLEVMAERRVSDEALHLHQEVEPPRFAARENLRVVLGLEISIGRLIDRLEAAQEL